LQGAGDL
jgi:hypothetical protein